MQREFLGLCELCVCEEAVLQQTGSRRLVVLLILLHESVIQQKEVLGEGR